MEDLDKEFDKKFGVTTVSEGIRDLPSEIKSFIRQREKDLLEDFNKFIELIPKSGKPVQVWREGKSIYIADPDRMFEKKELSND